MSYRLLAQKMLVDVKVVQKQGAAHTMHHQAGVGGVIGNLQQPLDILESYP